MFTLFVIGCAATKLQMPVASTAKELNAPIPELTDSTATQLLEKLEFVDSKRFISKTNLEDRLYEIISDNQIHEQFQKLNTKNWKEVSKVFQLSFLRKAKEAGLDSAGLARCFEQQIYQEKSRLAQVPIYVEFARNEDEYVWIIHCVWELERSEDGTEYDLTLSHVSASAIGATTKELIARASFG